MTNSIENNLNVNTKLILSDGWHSIVCKNYQKVISSKLDSSGKAILTNASSFKFYILKQKRNAKKMFSFICNDIKNSKEENQKYLRVISSLTNLPEDILNKITINSNIVKNYCRILLQINPNSGMSEIIDFAPLI